MLTENQKKKLIGFQDVYTLEQFGKLFNMSPKKVYEEYDNLLLTGEYFTIYKKNMGNRRSKRDVFGDAVLYDKEFEEFEEEVGDE